MGFLKSCFFFFFKKRKRQISSLVLLVTLLYLHFCFLLNYIFYEAIGLLLLDSLFVEVHEHQSTKIKKKIN